MTSLQELQMRCAYMPEKLLFLGLNGLLLIKKGLCFTFKVQHSGIIAVFDAVLPFLQQLLLFAAKLMRYFRNNPNMKITCSISIETGHPFAFQTKHLACLGSGSNFQP